MAQDELTATKLCHLSCLTQTLQPLKDKQGFVLCE